MKFSQVPHRVLMVRPTDFESEARISDIDYLSLGTGISDPLVVRNNVIKELAEMEATLRAHDIDVRAFSDHHTNDIFVSNWISTHADGHIIIHPPSGDNDAVRPTQAIIEFLKKDFEVREVIDLSRHISRQFFPGAFSMIFDHYAQIIYATHCDDSSESLAQLVAEKLLYRVIFSVHLMRMEWKWSMWILF